MIEGEQYWCAVFDTPLGKMLGLASDTGIRALLFEDANDKFNIPITACGEGNNKHLLQLEKELRAYFEGKLKIFTVQLDSLGSPFQLEVWKHLCMIPYGSSITYGEMASEMGDVKKIRAVANANATNPILLIIPCHRVIGAGRKLTGYCGGLDRKRWLLDFENEHSEPQHKTTLF